jgi:hypothetical protein
MDRPMNKNVIQGRRGEASWHNTAKPQVQATEVNGAVVSRSNAFLPGEIPRRKCRGKSAEAIVVANEPGAGKRPHKHETGSLDAMKGRTDEEFLDPVEGLHPDKASWPGSASSRHSGKHGGVRGEATGRELEVAASEEERAGNSQFQI